MRWITIVLYSAFLLVASNGCVPQAQFDILQAAQRKSQEQVIDLKARLEERDQRIDQMRNTTRNDPKLIAQLDGFERENLDLRQKLTEFEQRLAQIGPLDPLPAELDEALQDLARSNPELMSYDPDLGMVKFHSDLTFDLGSVAIKPAAAVSLTKLAGILNTPIAATYEVRILGHTDGVPIRKKVTRENHPTNWHLSVHRSIAVKDALAGAGVPEDRMGVAGYGPYRPVAADRASGGNELNRRVEIYLLPRRYQAPVRPQPRPVPPADTSRQPAPPPSTENPNVTK